MFRGGKFWIDKVQKMCIYLTNNYEQYPPRLVADVERQMRTTVG